MKTFKYTGTRRQFLKSTAAASLVYSLLPRIASATEARVIKKTIPSSGERLSVIGLGTSRTFDVSDSADSISPLVEVIQAFFDRGGQLIDSSPMYGNAESVTGALLEQVKNRQGLFTATKVWTNGRDEGMAQMQRSMERMGVDTIDLMQIHNLRDWRVHIETLVDWKAQGKIRYIGITTSHGRYHKDLEKIMQQLPLDFVQFSYNITDRAAEQRLLPIARERGIATLINRPFQRGSLFRLVKSESLPGWAAEIDCASWGQFFLKFIASHPGVTCIIPATSKLKHMVDNMTAGYGRLPDERTRQHMIEYVEWL
ncbi:MAG: aldo/keto reductase [Gammaproteobacteria bacterium]|nr:MAG: aldo/keto reductase [Gammaproteobacteria bacterium]